MKKIILLLSLCLGLLAEDIVVFENEYNVLTLEKRVQKLIVGNKELLNVSLLDAASSPRTTLKLFGKKSGNTSILILYKDKTIQNYHVYVNQNLGFIQKMVNVIEPEIRLNRVGDGSTVIAGEFKDPHEKNRVYKLLESAGIDMNTLMDLTQTKKVNKMVRTKLYLVEVNNQRAKDLGGVTGLNYFDKYTKIITNPEATASATFSGFLLDHTGRFVSKTGNSVVGTLNFLETKGIAKILDDTVLITTEDENASFHVGGEVYIPVGMTQNFGVGPTIQLEEKEYGLRLTLTSGFMEKEGFMHIDVEIKESEFDTNHEHDVQLGEFIVVPSFVSKNIKTDIVAQSGQVIALGGRLHTEEVEREEKVPFLGDIPLLGELFKRTVSGSKENDLLFFLVPEIVDANEELDDRDFYKEYKNSSAELHKSILDIKPSEAEPLVIVEDRELITKREKAEAVEEADVESVIEVEEGNAQGVIEVEKESELLREDEIRSQAVEAGVLEEKKEPEVRITNETLPESESETVSEAKVEEERLFQASEARAPVENIEQEVQVTSETPAESDREAMGEAQNDKSYKEKKITAVEDVVVEVVDGDAEERAESLEMPAHERARSREENILRGSGKTVVQNIKEEKKASDTESATKISKDGKQKVNRKYRVSVGKIFLRDKPVDGRRSDVWIKGHSFIAEAEEEFDGSAWLRVGEDCLEECVVLEKSLWIAKKFTEEL